MGGWIGVSLGSFAFNYFHHLDKAFSFLITLVRFNTSIFFGSEASIYRMC